MSLSINPRPSLPTDAGAPSFKVSQSIERPAEEGWVFSRRTVGDLQQYLFANEKNLSDAYRGKGLTNSEKGVLDRLAAISFFERGTIEGAQAAKLFTWIVDGARAKNAPNQTPGQKSKSAAEFNAHLEVGTSFQKGYFSGDVVPSLRF